MVQYYLYKKYDDAKLRKIRDFFENNGISYIEKDTLSEEGSKKESDNWNDINREIFPVVRIGEKVRALLFDPPEAILRKVLLHDTAAAGLNGHVTVYFAQWCGHCRIAKDFLAEYNVKFKEIDIEIDNKSVHKIVRWSLGRKVIPTILVGNEMIMFSPNEEMLMAVFS
ncbi:glutaredoxin family protein [candidate division KSB1 bacterium]